MDLHIYIDGKYGEGHIACNKRTADSLGKYYSGFRVIIDEWIGDWCLACHPKVFDKLKEGSVAFPEAVESDKKEEPIESMPEKIMLSSEALYKLKKKDQVKLLKSFGLVSADIRKLRREKDRVETILFLQEG